MKRVFASISFLVLVASCTRINSGILVFNKKLSGEWKIEGVYKDDKRSSDTLYTEYPNKVNEKDLEIIALSTDSGTYKHTFNKNKHLMSVKHSKEIEIIEFVFVSDHGGKLVQYQYPGFDQRFEVLESNGNFKLIFHNLDQTIDTTKILKLDSLNLEILWKGGYIEKYTRSIQMP